MSFEAARRERAADGLMFALLYEGKREEGETFSPSLGPVTFFPSIDLMPRLQSVQ